jgi:hypothetical protein
MAVLQPAVDAVMRDGSARLETTVGTVDAALRLPGSAAGCSASMPSRRWLLPGWDGDQCRMLGTTRRDLDELRRDIERDMVDAVIGLVGG